MGKQDETKQAASPSPGSLSLPVGSHRKAECFACVFVRRGVEWFPMRAVGVTRSAALSTGCGEHFREEEKGRPAHGGDPKGSANGTLVPTPDAERR